MTNTPSTRSTSGSPPGPGGDPLGLDNMRRFRADTLSYLLDLHRTYGDMVRFPFGPLHLYLVSHPDYVHQVYVEQAARFYKTRQLKMIFRKSLGNGLLTNDGESWKRQRRLVQPAFHARRIESYGQVMVDFARKTLDTWADGQVREIHHDMMKLTLGVVSRALFDADVSADADRIGNAITAGIETSNRRFNQIIPVPEWLPTRDNRRAQQALNVLDQTVMGFIRERRASGQDRGDLLSMLLQAGDEDSGGKMTDQQVRDEASTLFTAGHETTANALTWAWYLLSQHPQAEARLHAELDQALGGRPPSVQDLPGLVYTDWVVKESLRLYPPAWITSRQAIEDVAIGGYPLRKGAVVFISPWVSHRDPRYFDAPGQFRPERWDGGFEKQLPRGAYIPFAAGPRICIGNGFALMEARLVLAALAQRYRLELAPGQVIAPEPLITLRPRGGVRMRLIART